MATDLVVVDLDRTPSPQGREEWQNGPGESGSKGGRPLSDRLGTRKQQQRSSRSRSPDSRRERDRSYSPSRELRYSREGTNTTSREPHLERARLFVGNIEPGRTERRDIVKLFSSYGDVLGVSIHKGYAFVQMDRERTANKAINGEDGHTFMGSKIHVEFSQAALKAGAKFERFRSRSPPPYREREPRPPPPPPQHQPPPSLYRDRDVSRPHMSDYYLEDQEKHREERLARILHMEREIAMLRSNQDVYVDSRKSHLDAHDSYDKKDSYHRSSPQPPSLGYDSYYSRGSGGDRDRSSPYHHYRGSGGDRGGGTGISNGRGGYARSSPPGVEPHPPSRGGSAAGGGGSDGYRGTTVSYPAQFGGSGYNRSTGGTAVGYGHGGGGGGSSGKMPAPGWPASAQDKSAASRPPFANSGPWS